MVFGHGSARTLICVPGPAASICGRVALANRYFEHFKAAKQGKWGTLLDVPVGARDGNRNAAIDPN